LLVAALTAAACTQSASEPPSILLVTLDTVRADRIGAYGHADALTPAIDALAHEGVLFEAAIAPTPITLPTHASILTGVYPTAHGVHANGLHALGDEAVLVSEVLRGRGWRTGAFVGSYILQARFGLDQGFEVYRDVPAARLLKGGIDERPADEVVADALAWLSGLAPGERFFAWVHLYDPHAPYQAPDSWRRRVPDPYDAEIAFCDAQLARLLRGLEGNTDDLVIVVTADHGESLGDHGEQTHGVFVYDATLRVPLLIAGAPLSARAGTRVATPVSTARIAPTLLSLARIGPEELPQARLPSLPLFAAEAEPARPAYFETHLPYTSYRWRALRGLRLGPLKFIEGREAELYEVATDPTERIDVARRRPELAADLGDSLSALLDEHVALGWAEGRAIGSEEHARLAALGYVSTAGEGDPFDPALPDPRERIGDLAKLRKASARFEEARILAQPAPAATEAQRREQARQASLYRTEARELLRSVLDENPADLEATMLLSAVELALGDAVAAISLLERAVAGWPDNPSVYYNLALAYAAEGRTQDAAGSVQQALAIDSTYPLYVEWIVSHHVARGEFGRAAWWQGEYVARLDSGSVAQRQAQQRLEELEREMQARGERPTAPPGWSGES
jgi:arylsulfatase A-like enzyme